jgi:hypothetical protein
MNMLTEMSTLEYFALPYLNQSGLKTLRESPFLFKHPRIRESTPAQQFGTWFHTLLMENELFWETYIPEPVFQHDGRSLPGKTERRLFREASEGKGVISNGDYQLLNRMREAALADPVARQLFAAGKAEQTLIWEDETGILCKARIDWLPDAVEHMIVDVKTASSANPSELQRSVIKWGYHIQDAWYRRGYAHVFGREPDFIFSFHEKPKHPEDEPIPPVLIELDRNFRAAGQREVARLLTLYQECVNNNEWPSYTQGITLLSPPPWFKE